MKACVYARKILVPRYNKNYMVSDLTATAVAHPNIAFIKYWGNRDDSLRLPSTGSISMNLASLYARTHLAFDPALKSDTLELNGRQASSRALVRVQTFLDLVRHLAVSSLHAHVVSENNFPIGAGIASSAAAFAALCLAASHALGLQAIRERAFSPSAPRLWICLPLHPGRLCGMAGR